MNNNSNVCLHQLFEEQVKRTPDAVALIYQDREITYKHLNRQADLLSLYLRQAGIVPESRVALCLNRTPELIIAVLGILKAGGAYIPLDPLYPVERLEYMLADANVSLILTQKAYTTLFSQYAVRLLDIDSDYEPSSSLDTIKHCFPEPANLAYIIYTSGSTGRPKGVAIQHSSACSFVEWAGEVFTESVLAGVLATTSICFDLSIFEIFVPLSYGGTVILAENLLQLPELGAAERITLINTVPSVMTALLNIGRLPSSIRTVNLAGESLPLRLVQRLYRETEVEHIYNLYGPSEDTTYSTWMLIPDDTQVSPPIGYPITGSQAYILNERMEPAAPDEDGELYLGGKGLARGYLHRPDLTAEKFVPDPFTKQAGARLYKTGDLVSVGTDGALTFLGRIDQQVKIHGFRIELGEIETILQLHPQIQDVVVLAREDEAMEKQLVAYVYPYSGTVIDITVIRDFLCSKLPAYMFPTALVLLSSIPLSPNGKVDRKALAALPIQPGSATRYVAPQMPLEQILVDIWQQLFEIKQIGIQDNFFALGGHSLLAARMASLILERLSIHISPMSIFTFPTIEQLSTHLQIAQDEQADQVVPPLQPVKRDRDIPLSLIQEQWFVRPRFAPQYVDPVSSAFSVVGWLDIAALKQSLHSIVQRHEILRTHFLICSGQPIQRLDDLAASSVPVSVIDLCHLVPKERAGALTDIIDADRKAPFDLMQDMLLRAKIVRLKAEEHVVILTVDHIACDGQSYNMIIRELSLLYSSLVKGEPSPLAQPKLQYGDFAFWQRQWLRGSVLEQHLAWWRKQLDGAHAMHLSTYTPRETCFSLRGETVSFELPTRLVQQLRQLSESQGVTPFITLLAVFQTLLTFYTRQFDISTLTPVGIRNPVEAEDIVGMFVTMVVLRTSLSGDPTFQEVMRRVRDVTIETFPHQDIPYEMVLEVHNPLGDRATSPFQVWFTLERDSNEPLQLEGVTVQGIDTREIISTLDMWFLARERGDTISGYILYRADLFQEEFIKSVLDHFQMLVMHIVEHPERSISELLSSDDTR
ncbi:non-ribosomal peptide synthetase [Dictyobacter arantiisoli]|uniref:Carrier domain-containing protein n=1 Tax=Dictyobacter arantiisoli TaxID=2014874 RepID=A0A5A5TAG0_9CHLR|nr:non-ribosomal peptide synthetase [Dictyobacter arantiisoli]GCF08003.1 hypothetical protein KDI_15670 [Dictyobacter arantiisoli]